MPPKGWVPKSFCRAPFLTIQMTYPEFPDSDNFTTIGDILNGVVDGKSISVRGWIYRTRSSGKLSFIVLRDSTGIIQSVVSSDSVSESSFTASKKALVESSVLVTGTPIKDERAPGGWELKVSNFEVLHYADTFPITKDQSDEHLLNNRHLWLRSRDMVSCLKIRSTIFQAFRNYWISLGYAEVQSPSFTTCLLYTSPSPRD